jgi:hypothetical protein
MATELLDIRAGIAANLSAVYGTTTQVSAYMRESPSPPTLQVKGPDDVEYNEAMGAGMGIWTLIIQGFAGTAFDIGAQTLLDEWISVDGVKAAVEAERTLSGKVHDLTVERCRHYGMFHLPSGMSFLGAEWSVAVYVPGA